MKGVRRQWALSPNSNVPMTARGDQMRHIMPVHTTETDAGSARVLAGKSYVGRSIADQVQCEQEGRKDRPNKK